MLIYQRVIGVPNLTHTHILLQNRQAGAHRWLDVSVRKRMETTSALVGWSISLWIITKYPGWWLTYPSEKWWSSPVGMMTFPTEWTNKIHVPNHLTRSSPFRKWQFPSAWVQMHLATLHIHFSPTQKTLLGRFCGDLAGRVNMFVLEMLDRPCSIYPNSSEHNISYPINN